MPYESYSSALAQQLSAQQQAASFYGHGQCYPNPPVPMEEKKKEEPKINKKLLLLED